MFVSIMMADNSMCQEATGRRKSFRKLQAMVNGGDIGVFDQKCVRK